MHCLQMVASICNPCLLAWRALKTLTLPKALMLLKVCLALLMHELSQGLD